MPSLRIPSAFMHPDVMAVGDSLYNGVRSLTLDADYCRGSAPSLVAHALGAGDGFLWPDPPRNIVVDLPRWLRAFPDIDRIRRDLADNVAFWLTAPKSPRGKPFFDNVAIASTVIADLYTDTWRRANDRLAELVARHGDKLATLEGPMADLFLAFNTRFTLNPMGLDELADATELDLVEARAPKRLLVSTGSNNGLWEICFEGKAHGRVAFDGIGELAERLNRIAERGTIVYFNLLPPPSTVPNLMPIPDYAEYEAVGTDRYYDCYENRFGFGYGRITGDEMRALDTHVAAVNAEAADRLRSAFTRPERLHFVDMWSLLKRYDAKHLRDDDSNCVVTADGKRFSNVMLEADFWGAFRCGGAMSLDGMHPSAIGYGLMAQQVVDTIRANPADPAAGTIGDIDFDGCYRGDTLLCDMPGIWSAVMWIWRDIRRARARGEPDPVKGGKREEVVTDAVMSGATRIKRATGL